MTVPEPTPARHDAVQYGDDQELFAAAVPFLRAGLDAGESVLLLCQPATADRLSWAVGDGHRLAVLPYGDVYGSTVSTLAAYRDLVDRARERDGARVRVVNEIDFGSAPSVQWEWARFEAAFNQALAPYPLWNLCLYDRRRLPPEIVRAGAATHPHLVRDGDRVPSADYTDPARLLGADGLRWRDPLEDGPPRLDMTGPLDLAVLRAAVEQALLGDGMGDYAVRGFVLAVSEVATNAMTHGLAPIRVRLWSAAGRAVCSVRDEGACFSAYSGYVPTDRAVGAGGMGLWLARQMTDDMTITSDGGGCTVRLGLNA